MPKDVSRGKESHSSAMRFLYGSIEPEGPDALR